jgi:hypothetical protein
MARKFKGISFTAAEDPALTKNRRCNVEDSHAPRLYTLASRLSV